jgi:hypothetical protein
MTSDRAMQEEPIDEMRLDNGLTLYLYDRSRPVAGDRWLVSFVARIDVEVRPEYFKNKGAEGLDFDEIKSALGDRVTYHHEKKRNFIAEVEKDRVFKSLKDRFLGASLGYLSSFEFPRKLVLMRYQEALGQRVAWKRQ